MSIRVVIGLLVFSSITVIAFQAEPHFGWIMLLITLAFAGVTGSILWKALRQFKVRYGAEKK
ncbi:hypothetical protein [Armatimonas rosea]|uniref:Cytoskeletal protein RodZ n=1 Tax=Armatimonas rosea TaxID=685828 RepID=A0A7W9SP61_ARMRO|nr:hypothetical protein [Armatimonas rosea]MBB6049483.1 cytoskeletal protein RodZ [Armatimonas rosea]